MNGLGKRIAEMAELGERIEQSREVANALVSDLSSPAEWLFGYVWNIYRGSDGDATKAFYARLEGLGPVGVVALNLFRAQKNSSRAKVYRRRSHRGAAYDRKQWAIDNLATVLSRDAEVCELTWGWGVDPTQPRHNVVLYVDLPTGQVSFHTDQRGNGPEYSSNWDGMLDQSADRICRWCIRLLSPAQQA